MKGVLGVIDGVYNSDSRETEFLLENVFILGSKFPKGLFAPVP
jgi:hypothetical protein